MKIKAMALLLVLVVATALMAGCAAKPAAETAAATTAAVADAVSGASMATDPESFLKAAGKDGTWIIYTLADMTIDKEIVLEGEFKNKDVAARKIALYTQDADHKVLERFKLTAPKLTVKSENARIQGGTFIGDVYVEAKGFMIVDATVEGNVYFASEEIKSTFKFDKEGKVTGSTEVK